MTNEELFQLYDSDLVLRLHSPKNLSDTRKFITRFNQYLGSYPPSPEIARSFLAQYADRKPRTLYRYAQMLRMFMAPAHSEVIQRSVIQKTTLKALAHRVMLDASTILCAVYVTLIDEFPQNNLLFDSRLAIIKTNDSL